MLTDNVSSTFEIGSRDLTALFQGWFVIRRLALAAINLSTKFDVSISTHYEDTKGDTKCRNWDSLG